MPRQAKWDISATNLSNFGSEIEKKTHYQAGAKEQAWANPATKVQDHESQLFLSYFPHFHVEEGGVSTGFNHHKPHEYRHRLLKIKLIERTVVIREVPKDYTSLNSGDVFILDVGNTLYQLNGKDSQGVEKGKAAEFVQAVKSERNGLADIIVVGDREMPKFWEALGSSGPIKSASMDTGADMMKVQKKLFRVSDSSGSLSFKEESGPIDKSRFDTNDVFIFDAGHTIFVWIGLKSTAVEKKYSLQYAQDYIEKHHRPDYTPITRVMEGGENNVFLRSFEEQTI
ncbi:4556_t:CDS:2 [Acaulospora colombiana]|uniref:4556_t:CDS:1 n=1 Tax=Acaulospora colombiana TaxID=27376 RepID=A0ACA9M0X2_9GLOM|nr:4556_t:CDS:2 [Acaulospora colombiana]